MNIYRIIFPFVFLLFSLPLLGQLTGRVLDENGNALPYASVYIENTYKGTVTNNLGNFTLPLEDGTYTIKFQFVGYETVSKTVNYPAQKSLIVQMALQKIGISEVVIAADAEDPAYPIIRKAIAKRKYYKELIPAYNADVYIKGLIKMEDAPEKILGEEVGNLDGLLDSTKQGILYLTESQSKVYWERPNKMKEILYASKTSGENDMIELNNLSQSFFDFYKERIPFERDIICPIADDAFTFYKYKLEGTFYDNDGQEINKIQVIPKDPFRPIVSGYIYIVEDFWNIHSLDFNVSGKSMKSMFYDTVNIKQVFVPIVDERYKGRHIFSQSIGFFSNFWGFKVRGAFNYIFKDYEIQEKQPDGFIDNEVFKVEQDAEKDNAYWEKQRPIPLTKEEIKGYIKRDSLMKLWESKPYLDSIDRAENRFKWNDILGGYTLRNSYTNTAFSINGLTSMSSFNAVEGYRITPRVEFRYFNDKNYRFLRFRLNHSYGFSDKRHKLEGEVFYRMHNKSNTYLQLSGGRRLAQIDQKKPIPRFFNTMYTLIEKKHLFHVFQKDFLKLNFNREWTNGLFIRNSIEYASRELVNISTDFSLYNDGRDYVENAFFANDPMYNLLLFRTRITWYPGLTYLNYPAYKIRQSSRWPAFRFELGTTLLDGDVSQAKYTQLEIGLFDRRAKMNIFGFGQYNLKYGGFVRNDRMDIMDQYIPLTNNVSINLDKRYFDGYKLMPYYTYNTDQNYFSGIYEHHFDGFIFDKIPGIRSIGGKSILGVGVFKSGDLDYKEVSFGIENLQLFIPAFFRLDYIWNWDKNRFSDHGFVFSISVPN